MNIKCFFICAKHYDFFDQNGIEVKGTTAYVFDENSSNIVKVKVLNIDKINGLVFGDTIEVVAVPSGRYLHYEV